MKKLFLLLLSLFTSTPSLELYQQPEVQKSIVIYGGIFGALTVLRYTAQSFCTEESLNCSFLKKFSFATPKIDIEKQFTNPIMKTIPNLKKNLEALLQQKKICPLKWAARAAPLICSSLQQTCCKTLIPLLIAPDLKIIPVTALDVVSSTCVFDTVFSFDLATTRIQDLTAFNPEQTPYESLTVNEIIPFYKADFLSTLLFQFLYGRQFSLGFLLAYRCGFHPPFFDATTSCDGRLGKFINLAIYAAAGFELNIINNIIFEKIKATNKDGQGRVRKFLINNQRAIFDTLFGFSLFVVASLICKYMTKDQRSFAFGS